VQENHGSQRQSAANFPPETGKLAVITCCTSGIGFDIALALARAGADVILAGRQSADGHEALGRIRPLAPHALVRFESWILPASLPWPILPIAWLRLAVRWTC